jgi:hypothetical protein
VARYGRARLSHAKTVRTKWRAVFRLRSSIGDLREVKNFRRGRDRRRHADARAQ